VTDQEAQELARLLRKVSAEELGVPRLPKDVFVALRGVVAQPAVELVVSQNGRDVLLTPRQDKHWSGWHLPGGFVGVSETLEAACERIARKELGAHARMTRLIGHYAWTDHPYASALSLLCECTLDDPPRDGEYFSQLPDRLISQHRRMLERWWPAH
jgi:ADP-ribose pyrophosphatase YjhB (NUDIX family)